MKKSVIALCAGLMVASVLDQGLARAEKALLKTNDIKANKTMLFDVVKFADLLYAPGELGVILKSPDNGSHWRVFSSVPTNRALTSLVFVDENTVIAAGHGGTVFRSDNGGGAWQKIEITEIGKDSILGIMKTSDGRLFLYGAFGLFLESNDKGKSWTKRSIIDEDFDRHISRIVELPNKGWFAVGESGTAAISNDAGLTWQRLDVGYEGSLFGALATKDGSILVYGMRGNVFRSADNGKTWSKIPIDSKSALNAGAVSDNGKIALVGNNGLAVVSNDHGLSFKTVRTAESNPLSGVHITQDGVLVYVGYQAVGIVHSAK